LTVAETIVSALKADPSVSALVRDRIFPSIADEDAERPFLVYRLIKSEPLIASEGKVGDGPMTYQVDSCERTDTDAERLADAVEACLEAMNEVDCSPLARSYIFEQGNTGADNDVFGYRQNFVIWP
jgi:hypothetical protein